MRIPRWTVYPALVLIGVFTSFYTVDPEEVALVLRFGKFDRTAQPGKAVQATRKKRIGRFIGCGQHRRGFPSLQSFEPGDAMISLDRFSIRVRQAYFSACRIR